MAYATQADLIDWCGMTGDAELKELTDPLNTTINAAIVADKLDQADHEMNSRLVGVTLPMSAPYPRLLVDICCRIARFLLYTNGRPDYITDDYLSALKTLDDIRMGRATLGLAGSGTAAIAPAGMAAIITAPSAVFTDSVLGAM